MKKAIMYGAGSIGRGFIGQTFSLSGYEVVFVDVDRTLVDAFNRDRRYPVRVVTNEGQWDEPVSNVRAVSGLDADAVAEEISGADLMATAVGVNILPRIAPVLAKGLSLRWKSGNLNPLNIIICENRLHADSYMRELIGGYLSEAEKPLLPRLTGFVEASIGRMVPVMTEDQKRENPLLVYVEPYNELPVDRDAFVGPIPELVNLKPYSPFDFYIKRKLFIHNMGHATAACLGWFQGFNYIYEAVGVDSIRSVVREAMLESALALSREYGQSMEELTAHIDDLIFRFGNRRLGDTILRVAKDPARKLSDADRFFGAVGCCLKNGVAPRALCIGAAAMLCYNPREDEMAAQFQKALKESGGVSAFLKQKEPLRQPGGEEASARIEAACGAFSALGRG